jgi:hypothetical protein
MECGVMPKETIRTGFTPNDPGVTIHVGWQNDHHVQIATVDPRYNDERPDGNGWYATVNRYEINKLIKTLRRARDAAYGRDE